MPKLIRSTAIEIEPKKRFGAITFQVDSPELRDEIMRFKINCKKMHSRQVDIFLQILKGIQYESELPIKK